MGAEDTARDRSLGVLTGIGLALAGTFVLLSLVPTGIVGDAAGRIFPSGNVMGPLGAVVAGGLLETTGLSAIVIPALLFLWAFWSFGAVPRHLGFRWSGFLASLVLLMPALIASVGAPVGGAPFWAAGSYGASAADVLRGAVGWLGSTVVLLAIQAAALVATLGTAPIRAAARFAKALQSGAQATLRRIGELGEPWGRRLRSARGRLGDWAERIALPWPRPSRADRGLWSESEPDAAAVQLEAAATPTPEENGGSPRPESYLPDPGDPTASDLPPLELLSTPPRRDYSVSRRDLDRLGEILIETLRTFGVDGEIKGRTTGPVVTQFEVVPASGVKVGKIAALDDDLALALKAPSVRIVAPIPGKGAVGVEVPNPEPKIVYLRELLSAKSYRQSQAALPLGLGEDVTGRTYVADLSRMPHLLIAGVTGSGKSVCINSIISSLIYRHPPERLRLLLIDPKMVELAAYNDLPHLRHPVVTDNDDAAGVLKWLLYEMERRYDWLSANGARNLREYNKRIDAGMPVRAPGSDDAVEEPQPWPYIVLLIDELADLMMTVQSEVERPLAFLAQKARATGIHLVVATQRPSVNIITGLIKANFPCRIAFRVASKVDSRTIIDQNGAETLLGNGDMLFLPPGEAEPIRIQGTYVATEDTERLMEWYRARAEERLREAGEDDILDVVREREREEAEVDVAQQALEDRDELFRQAAEIIIQHDQGSTSLLQRRLRIGYGRAARIVDQLHHAGIVGPPEGSKPREVLVTLDELERICSGQNT